MTLWQRLKRPPWRTLLLLAAILGIFGFGYLCWTPGERITDGRHDLRRNGIWLQHGWMGDDGWFKETERDASNFRDAGKIAALRGKLERHGIRDVFPHLCPCEYDGAIAAVDDAQTERFLDGFEGFRVMPWVGGVKDDSADPSSPKWRARFVETSVGLLIRHPRLAGLHVNIEPMPDGEPSFLLLLEELRKAMPPGKILSIAAYPPPTRWHPFPEVHWGESYFREVAKRVDQIVPMLYDTGLTWEKPYRKLMVDWTHEVLAWSEGREVLLGVPAYDDAGTGYHDPRVEDLENALRGIHAALEDGVPAHYAGISVYSEWEMSEEDWKVLGEAFNAPP
ncbi:glycosyl hydrolase family 18 protein [Luteolibacter flavescens]|uniref:Glycosyl hydrolase family 18 protein n=1 Tax=Luteolibacter flavescens TaxID=1859460 RepID=A0ABT3FUG9_9BACT|nr:glycosyl hydrolase family 18 protein [Luteolibacter flavescens]MCW1886866.1 glycosyl hydrolase family 18 protein [Luteolibacter flavescens]